MFVAVGTAAVTTQYMARTLNYTSALGEPLIHLKGIPFYQPFKAYNWLFQLTSGGVVSKFTLSCIGFLLAGLFFAVMILIFSLLARSKGTLSNVHGSARWAQKQDIIEAGLLPRPDEAPTEISVYTGGWVDPKMKRVLYLTHGGPEHILAFAPTRSGKGVGLVIPSLLRWAGSVLVYDIKGENYQLTSGWREKELGSVSIRLDPTDPDAFEQGTSGTFNPLEELQLDYGHKTPPPKGTWPAIWTLGTNINKVGWPACGEIDIMEFVGFEPDKVYANVHTRDYNHTKGTGRGGKIITEKITYSLSSHSVAIWR